VLVCERCGGENPEGFQFCGSCGAALTDATGDVRKTVTVLFSDVTGSTALGERLDPETLRSVMSRYFDVARTALERHGGTVEKFIGDAVMAVFGVPEVHEDDALRAVRAAVELRDGLGELNEELERSWGATLRIRTGVNSGDVVAGDPAAGQAFVSGDAVNVAARLEQAATPGEILIGASTLALVRDAVRVDPVEPLSLKGKTDPVPAFRLLEVVAGAPAFGRRLDSPMLGRDAELAMVLDAFDRAEREPGCELATIVGVAGVGKSRMIREVSSRLADRGRVLEGHCLPYGEGITFWPVAEIVHAAAGIEEADTREAASAKLRALVATVDPEEGVLVAERVGAAIGLREGHGAIQETFWAIRRLFETLAVERPFVAVIDDIHWAEPTLLDLVEYLAGFSRDHAVLVLCTARPELRESRPDWGRSGSVIQLQSLDAADSAQLVEHLLGHAQLPPSVHSWVVESAEGNPLFVEEMLRMLIDDGLLRHTDGRWVTTGDLAGLAAPTTVQALIAARLDRLHEDERAVIQRASVAGKVFYWGAVTELSPESARAQVGGNLQTLLRKELILPELSPFAGEDAFRFSHILVHDAAYTSMPKRTRADLHERFAIWLERMAGARLSEFEEIVGYHLERSYRYLSELGPADDRAREVASRAAARLGSAGRRAYARGDLPAAASLLSRATDLVPARDPLRVSLLPELGAVLTDTGAWPDAEAILRQAVEEARATGDRRAEGHAIVRSLWLAEHNGRFSSNLDAIPRLDRAMDSLAELGDDVGLADGWVLRGSIEFWNGRAERAVAAADRAVGHAHASGDQRLEVDVLRQRSFWVLWGPAPADELASAYENLMSTPFAEDPRFRSSIARLRAYVEAMKGNAELARELADDALRIARELGMDSTGCLAAVSYVAMHAGQPARAEDAMREAIGIFREMGDVGHLSSYGPMFADALVAQGRFDEALPLTEEAERVAIRDDMDAQVHWRRVRAKILAHRDQIDEAVALATQAVDLARRTDDSTRRVGRCSTWRGCWNWPADTRRQRRPHAIRRMSTSGRATS
jgi:class 3 adenylate cyclase/tetratricopeptide (TPR) repeat protein